MLDSTTFLGELMPARYAPDTRFAIDVDVILESTVFIICYFICLSYKIKYLHLREKYCSD